MEGRRKKVTFNDTVEICLMCAWAYAYRKSRECYWEMVGRDAGRFTRRIKMTGCILDPILVKKKKDVGAYMTEGIMNSYMKMYIG